jgi:hypothetical protein
MCTACEGEENRKEGKPMALFTIMRIYEIPADDRIEATDRMLEALELGTEKDYHVRDIVRKKDETSGHWKPIALPFSTKMVTIFKRQFTGKSLQIGGEVYGKVFSQSGNTDWLRHRRPGCTRRYASSGRAVQK